MGATVSREHARLPFAYTHARKEDHSYNYNNNASSTSLSSTRQRIASRLLLLKSPDTTTSVTPLTSHRFPQQQHLIQQGQRPEDFGPGSGPNQPHLTTLSGLGSHMTASEEDDEDAEIVSLSSILIQGPEFEIKWHAVGEDDDYLDYNRRYLCGDDTTNQVPVNTTTTTATATSDSGSLGQPTMAILSTTTAIEVTTTTTPSTNPVLQDTDSGHETCFLHSRSTTLESVADLNNRETGQGLDDNEGNHRMHESATVHSETETTGQCQHPRQPIPPPGTLLGSQTTCSPSSPPTPTPPHAGVKFCALTTSNQCNNNVPKNTTTTTSTMAAETGLLTTTSTVVPVATTLTPSSPPSPPTPPSSTSSLLSRRDGPAASNQHAGPSSEDTIGDEKSVKVVEEELILYVEPNHGLTERRTHNEPDCKESNTIDADDSEEEEEDDFIDDDDCEESFYEALCNEAKRTKRLENRKMDLIAALGIADLPDDNEFEPEPFNFFKGEPIFHNHQYDRFHSAAATATRRYTTDGITSSGRGGHGHGGSGSGGVFRPPWGFLNHDDYAATVHLPEDFFESHRGLQSSIDEEEEEDFDELEEPSDLDQVLPNSGRRRSGDLGRGGLDMSRSSRAQDQTPERGRLRQRFISKGKGVAGRGGRMGHFGSQSTSALPGTSAAALSHPWMMGHILSAGDEDVAHLSPIPFSELPSLTNIGLCSKAIVKLSSNIRLLTSATSLQVCCNDLCSIPVEIGHLRNLTLLDLSKNSLTTLPSSIRYLTRLQELKLSFNFLESLPPVIGELTKLTALHLDSNRLERLPRELGRIKGLAYLDLDDNPLTVLPAEIGQLQFLRRLKLDRCPLVHSFVHSPVHSPPTLLELAARVVVRHGISPPSLLPSHIKIYLRGANKCSFCEGPYFESFVKRGKMIEKNDLFVPLEYSLCVPHWNTERERVRLMFCPRPSTAPPLPLPLSQQHHHLMSGSSRPGSQAGSRRASRSDGVPLPPPPPATSLPTTASAGNTSTTTTHLGGPSTAAPSMSGEDMAPALRISTQSTRSRGFRSRLRSSAASTYSIDAISTNNTAAPLPPVPPMTSPTSSSSRSSSRFSIRLRSRVPRSG